MTRLVRIGLCVMLCAVLNACLYDVTSEKQIYGASDLNQIDETEWKVLTAIAGNTPYGRSTEVSDTGVVEVTELSGERLIATEFENGVLKSRMEIARVTPSTAALRMIDSVDEEQKECLFGVAAATDDLFVVPSVGTCDGAYMHYFFARTDDPESNGFRFLGFDTKKLTQIEAIAAIHGIKISATRSAILVSGHIAPQTFALFAQDLFSAGLLR